MALASIFKPKKIKTQDKSAQPVKKGVAIETKPKILDPVTAVLDQNMDILDVLAPNRVEVDFDFIKINNVYLRALFVSGYPRFVSPGWLEQIINFNSSLDFSPGSPNNYRFCTRPRNGNCNICVLHHIAFAGVKWVSD